MSISSARCVLPDMPWTRLVTNRFNRFIIGFCFFIAAWPALAQTIPAVPAYVGVDPVPWWGPDPRAGTVGDQCDPVETQRIYDIDSEKLADAAQLLDQQPIVALDPQTLPLWVPNGISTSYLGAISAVGAENEADRLATLAQDPVLGVIAKVKTEAHRQRVLAANLRIHNRQLKPYLVRAVWAYGLTGGFKLCHADQTLRISYASAGGDTAAIWFRPLVILLEETPARVFTDTTGF